MKGARLRRTALSLLLLPVVAGATEGSQGAGCGIRGQIEHEPNGWTRVEAPSFSRGPAALTAYVVDPYAPDRWLATNGRLVMRSTDGGCTWSEVFHVPDALLTSTPGIPEQTEIVSIVIPASPQAHDNVHLLLRHTRHVEDSSVQYSVLVRSVDGGATWIDTVVDVPHAGAPVELVAAESAPGTLYLASTVPADQRLVTAISVSHDGGQTWARQPAGSFDASGPLPEIRDLAVDPLDPLQLWAAGSTGSWSSEDGGTSWVRHEQPGPAELVDVFHAPGSDARVWFLGSESSVRSDDAGAAWKGMPAVPFVGSATHGSTRDAVFATAGFDGNGVAYGFSAERREWVMLKQTNEFLHGASADRAAVPSFYAFSPYRIWKFSPGRKDFVPIDLENPPKSQLPESAGCAQADYSFPGNLGERTATLTPPTKNIVLAPGDSRTVPYRLALGTPSPVDVYFLIDTSQSMGPAICGVASGVGKIASRLKEVGIDAWFGVGTYQNQGFLNSTWTNPPCHSYRRDRDLAPLGPAFINTLNSMSTCGGAEPQMTALVQTATGSGHAPWVLPGQQASFRVARPTAIPIVVHIGDEGLNDDRFQSTRQDAVNALNAKGIRQVGIATSDASLGWLRKVAHDTGTLAEEPVDCLGNGAFDIQKGDPLVCLARDPEASAIPLADAVTDMILAMKEVAPVDLVDSPESPVVERIDPPEHPEVDLRTHPVLDFDVTYTCLTQHAGQPPFPVSLAGRVREDVVATATATVTCLGLPLNPSDRGLAGPAFAPPLPPAPAPFPQPQPGPQAIPQPIPQPVPNPGPQPQANPQAQGQSQAQAGLVVQKQEQTQTAFARASEKVANDEFAMSARRSDPTDAARVPAALAAGVLMLAGGCVARTRTRRAVARRR